MNNGNKSKAFLVTLKPVSLDETEESAIARLLFYARIDNEPDAVRALGIPPEIFVPGETILKSGVISNIPLLQAEQSIDLWSTQKKAGKKKAEFTFREKFSKAELFMGKGLAADGDAPILKLSVTVENTKEFTGWVVDNLGDNVYIRISPVQQELDLQEGEELPTPEPEPQTEG